MASIWRAGWLGAMAAGKRGPSLYYYDCPDQCCYGKGVCNPPDQFATWETLQQCLDATADPTCRFTAAAIFGLGDSEVKIHEKGTFLDATLLWKTFPNLYMDPARPARMSGFSQKDCVELVACHEASYPPNGDCSADDTVPTANAPPFNSFDYDLYLDKDAVWFSTNHWVAERPTLTLLNVKGNAWCSGGFASPVDVSIPIKIPLRGGDQLPKEVMKPW